MNNYFEELGRIHAKDCDEKSIKTSALSFQLSEKNLHKLDYLCKIMGINRSKFIHMLLEHKLFDALDSYVKASHKTIDELNLPKDIRNRFQAYISLKELEKQEHKK
jgi:hypothetical protein